MKAIVGGVLILAMLWRRALLFCIRDGLTTRTGAGSCGRRLTKGRWKHEKPPGKHARQRGNRSSKLNARPPMRGWKPCTKLPEPESISPGNAATFYVSRPAPAARFCGMSSASFAATGSTNYFRSYITLPPTMV